MSTIQRACLQRKIKDSKKCHKSEYPPAQNQYMQETILGELIFARIHAGPVFALARIQENIFEEVFPEYCAKFLGEFIRCEYMPRLDSHPREYRKISLANHLCIGFVPGGKLGNSAKLDPRLLFKLGRSAASKIIYVRPVGSRKNTSNIGKILT